MAFIQFGSVVTPILTEAASQPESDRGGGVVRAFAGNLRSSLTWSKRKWQFTTAKLTFAEEAILLTAIGSPDGGNVVACLGNFNNAVSVDCLVLVTGREYFKISSTAIKRRLTLTLQEV